MTKLQKQAYQSHEELQRILHLLLFRKFKLHCGHHVTFGYFLGNDITVRNGKELIIICNQCGY